ncbi:hypothetical protein WICMUC_002417 [Wickerhamomyces mucosus]|uniref:Uncharacterized protein n=1 Tax=Wickerhamomyces mucosus TaxID=1378264 RepID=A0A9P8PR23_9ASCO|nr:hypothetical protein WICMUC_002417 [Wickerhamomyces mucosus]
MTSTKSTKRQLNLNSTNQSKITSTSSLPNKPIIKSNTNTTSTGWAAIAATKSEIIKSNIIESSNPIIKSSKSINITSQESSNKSDSIKSIPLNEFNSNEIIQYLSNKSTKLSINAKIYKESGSDWSSSSLNNNNTINKSSKFKREKIDPVIWELSKFI